MQSVLWKKIVFFFCQRFLSNYLSKDSEIGYKAWYSDDCIVEQKTATYCIAVSLFVHFSSSTMKISVADFLAPIGASVFKFCVHLPRYGVYRVL